MNLKQNFLALNKIYDQQDKLIKPLMPFVACQGTGCSDCCKKVAIRTTMLESANICKYLSTLSHDILKNVKLNICKYDAQLNNIRKSFPDYFAGDIKNSEMHKIQNDIVANNIDSCPFLLNDSCSIYPARPLVCRQYVVGKKSSGCLGSVNTQLIDNKVYNRETLANIVKLHSIDADIFDNNNCKYYMFIARALDINDELVPILLSQTNKYICKGNQFEKMS